MNFRDFIELLKKAELRDPENKPGVAASFVREILEADLSDPAAYLEFVRGKLHAMIKEGVMGKIGHKSIGEVYDQLQPRKLEAIAFLQSIPGYASYLKYNQRKNATKDALLAILRNPQLLNEAMRSRQSIRLPHDSQYAQNHDYLAYLYRNKDLFKPDTGFLNSNAQRVLGMIHQSFDKKAVKEFKYDRSNFLGGNGRVLREVLLLEAAVFHLEAGYGEEDQADLVELSRLADDKIITQTQFENIVQAIRNRESIVTKEALLVNDLPEMVSILRSSVLVYKYSDKMLRAVADPLQGNKCLLNAQVVRDCTVPYPYAYLQHYADEIDAAPLQEGMNELRFSAPCPFSSIDLRGVSQLRKQLQDEDARKYFDALPRHDQIYLAAAVLDTENDLFQIYQHKIGEIQHEMGELSAKVVQVNRERMAKLESELNNLAERRGAILQAVMSALTVDRMRDLLALAKGDDYLNFMRAFNELHAAPANSVEEAEYKQVAVKAITESMHHLAESGLSADKMRDVIAQMTVQCSRYLQELRDVPRREADRKKNVEDYFSADMGEEPRELGDEDLTFDSEDDERGERVLQDEESVASQQQVDEDSMASEQLDDDKGKEDDEVVPAKVNRPIVEGEDLVDLAMNLTPPLKQKRANPVKSIFDQPAMVPVKEDDVVAQVHQLLPPDELQDSFNRILTALNPLNVSEAVDALIELSKQIDKLKPFLTGKVSANKNQTVDTGVGIAIDMLKEWYPGLKVRDDLLPNIHSLLLNGAHLQEAIQVAYNNIISDEDPVRIAVISMPSTSMKVFAALLGMNFTDKDIDVDFVTVDALAKNINDLIDQRVQSVETLRRACDDYMAHLGSIIRAGFVEYSYDSLWKNQQRGTELEPSLHEMKDGVLCFNVEAALARYQDEINKIGMQDESFKLAVQKYQTVKAMRSTLEGEQLPAEKLQAFRDNFENSRHTIEQRRDSGAIKFLKVLGTIFSFGLAYKSLWGVKGKEFTGKVDQQLPNGHKPGKK